jgi:hypothetical protein
MIEQRSGHYWASNTTERGGALLIPDCFTATFHWCKFCNQRTA